MSEIFRDPMWQFVGTIVAFAAIVISIILYVKQRKKKQLSYEIISRVTLLSVEEEIEGKVNITYEGKPIKQADLFLIKIVNSGNTPILASDYETPISVGFGKESQLLSYEVSEVDPKNLKVSIRTEGQGLMLEPTLLNERDSILIKALVSKPDRKITIDGRIVGVKRIGRLEDSNQFLVLGLTGLGFFFFGIIYGIYQLGSNGLIFAAFQPYFVPIIAIVFGYSLIIAAFVFDSKARRRLILRVRQYGQGK